MTLYFAYGSNMDRVGMARRCPGARAEGPARLDGWRYIVMTEGYASIVRSMGSTVHGVLWRLTARDVAALNAYESLDSGLYARRFVTVVHGRARRRVLTYIGRTRREGRPRPRYQEAVATAARDWNLPERYVRALARAARR